MIECKENINNIGEVRKEYEVEKEGEIYGIKWEEKWNRNNRERWGDN